MSMINSITGKSISVTAKRILAKQLDFARKNRDKFATNVMVLSLVSKDAVNCAFYTYQSYNNKRIPEENRKFVAALDFVQGFLNVGMQILASRIINKRLTPLMFDKLIGNKLIKGLSTKYTKEFMEISKKAEKSFAKDDVAKEIKTHLGEKSALYMLYKTGFGLIVTLLATTALCKRTLVPLIATPIAGKLKDKYLKSSDDKNSDVKNKMVDVTEVLSRQNNKDSKTESLIMAKKE